MQCRHPRCAHSGCRATLPGRIPERSTRRRTAAPTVANHPARRGAARPARPICRKIRLHLDRRGIAPACLDRTAGQTVAGLAWPPRPPRSCDARHALRPTVHWTDHRAPDPEGYFAHSDTARLPAIFGHHHRQPGRQCFFMEPTRTPFTRMAFCQQLLSTPAIHPGAGQSGATTLAAPRPRPHAPDELSRHT